MSETSAGRKADSQEPSMEDILASIRRILAEDSAPAAPEDAAGEGGELRGAGEAGESLPEVEDVQARPLSAQAEGAAADDLPVAVPFSEPAAKRPAQPSGRPPASLPEALAFEEADVFMLSPQMRAAGHTLVSPEAAGNSTDVLSQLARAILDRRDVAVATRDVTLESMVREMLRPLLREWLDRNLPYLIERLVKKEIDLMVNRAERLED